MTMKREDEIPTDLSSPEEPDMEELERIKEIQSEDSMSKGKFAITMILSCILGGTLGGGMILVSAYIDNNGIDFADFWRQFQLDLTVYLKWIMMAMDVILFLIAYGFFIKAKKVWAIKEARDDNWDRTDALIGKAFLISNVLTVVNIVLFTLSAYMISKTTVPLWLFMVSLVFFVLTIAGAFMLQQKSVNLLKEMNPEKKCSTFDMKFEQKWYESCDEAERKIAGIASRKTLTKLQYIYMAIIVIFFFLGFRFEFGIFPILMTGILWIATIFIYQSEVIKAEKNLKNE